MQKLLHQKLDHETYSLASTYRVEYELDNGTDEEKEEKKSNGSDEDSDIDNVQVNNTKKTTDDADWADSEFEMELDSNETNQKDSPPPSSKCLTCKEPVQPFAKYCQMCWEDRKTWIPIRKNPRRRCRTAKSLKQKIKTQKNIPQATNRVTNNPCTICYINTKNACFIHGQSSHQVCCYPCAKKIIKNKEKCPVCRRKIEKITKHFVY